MPHDRGMTGRPRLAAVPLALALLVTTAVVLAGCSAGFAPQGPPGATDAGFLGCQIGPQPGATVREGEPLAPGEPMAGVDVRAMTPRQVGELARARGLKVTWRYDYSISGGVGPGGPPLAGATPDALPAPDASSVASGDPTSPKTSSDPGGIPAGMGALGFSECWCEPPPDGTVTDVAYGMASELVVFVRSGRTFAAPRQQPTRGWGC